MTAATRAPRGPGAMREVLRYLGRNDYERRAVLNMIGGA